MKQNKTKNRDKPSYKGIYKITGILGILSLSIVLVSIMPVAGVPAPDQTTTLEQPDGSTFEATVWGDETSHGWETINGYTIIKQNNTWYYAKLQNGLLENTKLKVTKHTPTDLKKHIRPIETKTDIQSSPTTKTSRSHTFTCSGADFPTSGTIDIPVIAINFADTNPNYTTGDIQNVFFGGQGSFQDYYNEVSYGQFNPTGGPEGIAGWVQADHPHDYYGENNVRGNDKRPGELVQEAILKADQQGFDFSSYDNNNNGCVQVMIVHQGTGEEVSSSPSTDIWSHKSTLSNRGFSNPNVSSVDVDGVVVDGYSIQPEIGTDDKITTIGIIAHEFGHLIGLPDLYDTDGSSQGIGEWGLMGTGSWLRQNRLGDTPAHLTAWSKWELDWIQPTKIPKSTYIGNLSPVENNQQVYQIFNNPNGPTDWNKQGGSGQYFLLEYRKKTGYDSQLPGSGLAIWHIDETRATNRDENRKLVDLEAADGQNHLDIGQNRGDSGDLYRNGSFNDSTNPNSTFYNGTDSGIEIQDIQIKQNAVFNQKASISCQIINQPGKYSLTQNLTSQNTCIEIKANHITIQGNQHTITGQNQKTAIHINNSTDIEINNLTITGWNTAINYTDSNLGKTQNNNIQNNNNGIKLKNTKNIEITKNKITNNKNAIILNNSNLNNFKQNTLSNNQWSLWSKNSQNNKIQNTSIQSSTLTSKNHENIQLRQNKTNPSTPQNKTQIGETLDIQPIDNPHYISLNLSYNNTQTNQINESTIQIYKHNNSWQKIKATLNTQQNYIYSNITNKNTITILATKKQGLTSIYDTNNNNKIDRSELRTAILDYINNKITRGDLRQIILAYVTG